MTKINSLLSKIETLAARTPTDPVEIDNIIDLMVEIIRRHFDAYLVDIMWESAQGCNTELVLIATHETEPNGYTSRSVYNKTRKPNSLTGYAYENDREVWIVDSEGLMREKVYENEWMQNSSPVPENTIYEYNTESIICTEICHPLRVTVHEKKTRAAGVLNIELREPIYPSKMAMDFTSAVASVIEQLLNRKHAAQNADQYARAAVKEISILRTTMGAHYAGFIPKCFVAMNFSTPFALEIRQWLDEVLVLRGIQCLWPDTNDDITDAIWSNIKAAHFGIVISTTFNRNVMLEWGYMMGCEKPIIRLHHPSGDKEQSPFDVNNIKCWKLSNPGGSFNKDSVIKVLNEAIDQLMKDNKEIAALVGLKKRKRGKA